MLDISDVLVAFYENDVKPNRDTMSSLAANRDATLDRVKRGLEKLRAQGKLAGPYEADVDQGSYAMDLLIQQPNDDFDLDEGLLFDAEKIPDSPLDARKRVHEALMETGGNFSKDPEVRTNAVTVWYSEGHHVDLAIYRRRRSMWGSEIIEHASSQWKPRDPRAVENWFLTQLREKEPGGLFNQRKVPPGQLRRIVRLVKAFARSRPDWDLPGGMILTTLVTEVFQSNPGRDDIALVNTLRALHRRLESSTQVLSPIDSSTLTLKPKFEGQVRRLRARLGEKLPALDILDARLCTREQALRAWGGVFAHPTWTGEADYEAHEIRNLGVEVKVARSEGGRPYRTYSGYPLQKNLWLRFGLAEPQKYGGCTVHWTVQNKGDEAREASDLERATQRAPQEHQWQRTAYKGIHSMTCEVIKDRQVVARAVRKIRIGSR